MVDQLSKTARLSDLPNGKTRPDVGRVRIVSLNNALRRTEPLFVWIAIILTFAAIMAALGGILLWIRYR